MSSQTALELPKVGIFKYRLGYMTIPNPAYQSIDIPISGTFILVPESEFVRISDAIERTRFMSLPLPEELSVGFLLRHHREAKGFTQERLSELSEVGQKHISNIEKQITEPRWKTLEKLFSHLDPKFEAGVRYIWELNSLKLETA